MRKKTSKSFQEEFSFLKDKLRKEKIVNDCALTELFVIDYL
jgi:hypothetical protein